MIISFRGPYRSSVELYERAKLKAGNVVEGPPMVLTDCWTD